MDHIGAPPPPPFPVGTCRGRILFWDNYLEQLTWTCSFSHLQQIGRSLGGRSWWLLLILDLGLGFSMQTKTYIWELMITPINPTWSLKPKTHHSQVTSPKIASVVPGSTPWFPGDYLAMEHWPGDLWETCSGGVQSWTSWSKAKYPVSFPLGWVVPKPVLYSGSEVPMSCHPSFPKSNGSGPHSMLFLTCLIAFLPWKNYLRAGAVV